MAYENIEIENPNFCLTPQLGTFGTVNNDDPTTVFRIKNTAGGLVGDYTLSSNISTDHTVLAVEYVGPLNLTSLVDDVTFFTLERVPIYNDLGAPTEESEQCIIKRWELDTSLSLLNLKQQIIKTTTGHFHYDAVGMSVEHYHREFDNPHEGGLNYLDIDSASKVETGLKLFLGPSTDTDNIGAVEIATVSYVDGKRVYLNGTTSYQYDAGDPITFYNHVYVISKKGYDGDERYGTIFKLDALTGSQEEYTTSGEYVNVTGSKWSTLYQSVSVINGTQLIFIKPYVSYLNWRSMFLSNVTDTNTSTYSVYDVVFDSLNVYKLSKFATYKDDSGNKTTYAWTDYNYQQDTLLPYTNNVNLFTIKAIMVGQTDETTLYVQARDQFGVGLRDVNINLYKDGDLSAEFDPLNGQAVTDINGKASIGYTSGSTYQGHTEVSVKADKSSPFTGSQYSWNFLQVISKINTSHVMSLFADRLHSSYMRSRQIYDPFKIIRYERQPPGGLILTEPLYYLDCRSLFTNEGGGWSEANEVNFDEEYWPWFVVNGIPPPGRRDGPNTVGGGTWDWLPWEDPDPGHGHDPRPNIIFQLDDFTQNSAAGGTREHKALRIKQPEWFWVYHKVYPEIPDKAVLENGVPPRMHSKQIDEAEHDLQMSQLKLGHHTHWVDGDPYDELWTYVNLDQFIFVEDAVPAFWSEKNPRETDIWIRLRPFAFNLDGTTLKFWVREVWTEDDRHYDTGFYDVTDQGTITYFDAGGGVLGLEFYYQPAEIFHHNAVVYIHLEIYDEAPDPNFIYVDYWFKIIPDFNAPYLVNLDPDREEDQVPIDTDIYFEIKDDGAGIDIDSLEAFINSRRIRPEDMDIERVNDNHYKVTCDLPDNLLYGKAYMIGVKVADVSENRNVLRDSYRIYTADSDEPWFTDFDPRLCKRGMPKFTDVSFVVLGGGQGVDEETIRLQVHDKDVTDESNIIPIIYRVS